MHDPTDARLYDRMRECLVKSARTNGVELRQTDERAGPNVLRRQNVYARAAPFKRAGKSAKQLKPFPGRAIRDMARKVTVSCTELHSLLQLGRRLLMPKKTAQKKLSSLPEPQVECIGKGKAPEPFESSAQVGLATSAKSNWITEAEAYPGNPLDGHTWQPAWTKTAKILGYEPGMAIGDLGCRGNHEEGDDNI